MGSELPEKLGFAEIEARKRRERLLRLKRKAQGQLDDEEKHDDEPEATTAVPQTETQSKDPNQAKSEQLDELDLSNLAPRKVDWDLKRGIAKSLEILHEKTNEVITEIVRERLEEKEDSDRD